MKINYYERDDLKSEITADFKNGIASVKNFTPKYLDTAFGKKTDITTDDVMDFLGRRCFPQSRANCNEILRHLDIDFYNPLLICQKTNGKMEEDDYWLEFIWD